MKLTERLEIKSYEKIKEFLSKEHVGRVATIDESGYPQIIPMNFVLFDDAIYMHSFPKGEKITNLIQNPKVGFEVDRELEFLPSYFSHPTDASQADTLYISVVIKGNATLVTDDAEKSTALNELMKKYQPEGRYDLVTKDDSVLEHVAVIKVIPEILKGKYKIGQQMQSDARSVLAQKIFERNSTFAKKTLHIMGFEITDGILHMIDEPVW